jgi:hypothetical protein
MRPNRGFEGNVMHMKRLIFSVAVAAGMALVGCDDRPTPPLAGGVGDPTTKPAESRFRRPTTQALLEGHRSRTALIPLPLTMDVPAGWGRLEEVNEAGLTIKSAGLNLFQGATPAGEVQIQLSGRPTLKQDDLTRVIAAARKEQSADPTSILKVDLRDHGSVKIMERQTVGKPAELTTYDSNNQPHVSTESPFNWTITVLVPHENAYQVFELNFIGLTKSQFDLDKDFLTGVIATLDYAGDKVAPPLPSSTTQPAAAASAELPATAVPAASSPTAASGTGAAPTPSSPSSASPSSAAPSRAAPTPASPFPAAPAPSTPPTR